MIILIDAYNLLKTVLHTKLIEDAQLVYFLQLFKKYAQYRPSNELILIFDGGQDPYEVEQDSKHITVFHSGFRQSADEVIKKKLQLYQGYDVLLVTSDRELRQYGKQYQIESLGSMEFYKIFQDVISLKDKKEMIVAQKIHKTSPDENLDVDALMEFGSRLLVAKDQDKNIKIVMRHQNENGNSKKDKKLLRKIVKI